MIFSKLTLGLGAFALLTTGAAAYYRLDRNLHKERAEALEESNETLRKDLAAIGAADAAVTARMDELTRNAAAAAKALREARRADETLDTCLRYNPGIDLTGGLLVVDEDAGPSAP